MFEYEDFDIVAEYFDQMQCQVSECPSDYHNPSLSSTYLKISQKRNWSDVDYEAHVYTSEDIGGNYIVRFMKLMNDEIVMNHDMECQTCEDIVENWGYFVAS